MEYLKKAAARPGETMADCGKNVAGIIRSVRERGDEALLEYNTRFDGNDRASFRVSREELDAAYAKMTEQELDDLRQAARNIRAFAQAQLGCLTELEKFTIIPGSELGHRVIPVESCGCYVPGGSYPLFSTALMLVIPAKAAGVKRVAVCSPAAKGTQLINYKTLVAMDIAGADEIYTVGGAQSIAAFAYGTTQIPSVDVVVGPGNQYVAEAKRQCYGQVGIDFVAGPSEVLALADESADPRILAADMLAQSEHDRLAKGIIVTTSWKLGMDVIAAVERQLATLETSGIASASWTNYGEVILAGELRVSVHRPGDRGGLWRLCLWHQSHPAYRPCRPLYWRRMGRHLPEGLFLPAVPARSNAFHCSSGLPHGSGRGPDCPRQGGGAPYGAAVILEIKQMR